MGLVSSCLQTDTFYGLINSSYGQCVCLRCFAQHLIQAYTLMFQNGGLQAIPSQPIEQQSASTTTSTANPTCDTYRSPPRPLPYDDPRFAVRMTRRDKPPSDRLDEEESEPLRESGGALKCSDACDGKPKGGFMECDLKGRPKEGLKGSDWFGSDEDEDVCPTCLEEYSPENPKIVMQCSHDFHLGCIYEWMERSEACPVCGKKMVFSETS